MKPRKRGRIEIRTQAEKHIKKKNPAMVYAGKQLYSFLIPRKTSPGYIKVAVVEARTQKKPGKKAFEGIKFNIKKGKWVRAKHIDFLIMWGKNWVFYGTASYIAQFVEKNLTPEQRQRSFSKIAEVYHGYARLAKEKTLAYLPFSRIRELEQIFRGIDASRGG